MISNAAALAQTKAYVPKAGAVNPHSRGFVSPALAHEIAISDTATTSVLGLLVVPAGLGVGWAVGPGSMSPPAVVMSKMLCPSRRCTLMTIVGYTSRRFRRATGEEPLADLSTMESKVGVLLGLCACSAVPRQYASTLSSPNEQQHHWPLTGADRLQWGRIRFAVSLQ